MSKQRLWYAVQNNGDGSVNVNFFSTDAEATKFEEEMDEGWGEPSVGCLDLTIHDGVASFVKKEYPEPDFQEVSHVHYLEILSA